MIRTFLTIDVETSIGGAFDDPRLKPIGATERVFGAWQGKYYGIPLIIDILQRYGLRATFFVEVFNKYYFGESETLRVCDYLLSHEQDVQLHLHPNYLNFAYNRTGKQKYSDLLSRYTLTEQIELVGCARRILESYGVSNIVAFRAGCFGASNETSKALHENGFLFDSSYNAAFLGKTCFMDDMKINDAFELNGIWEFPVTNFLEESLLRPKRLMPLDLNGISDLEAKVVLDEAAASGLKNVTFILHSFSFLKAYDLQYTKCRPRKNVIQRFERVCEFLSSRPAQFEVSTFGSLDFRQLNEAPAFTLERFPRVPAYLSLLRGLDQLKDNFL